MKIHPSLKRLGKYSIAGGATSLLDILLLWVLTSAFGIFYMTSAAASFIVAHSVNYGINRYWNYRDTPRNVLSSYMYFIGFGITSLVLTLSLLAFLVEVLSVHYILARAIVALIVGIFNYTMNTKISFKSTLLK